MDYEKLHKDTIAKLQEMVNSGKISVETACGICADFVPENEDERIRKYLIKCVNENMFVKPFNADGVDKQTILAWLEKQKGTKRENEGNSLLQSEQKHVDKVEPKFHKGDWISHNTANFVFQVVSIGSYGYEVINRDNNTKTISFDNEENYHLWTIKDAKDGDVLHSTGLHNDCIFIFNGLDNWNFDEPNGDRAVATGYCCLFVSSDKMEFGMQGPDCVEVNTVKPATKEQRDLLFQRMKEEGYEWNAEKKELTKIGQNPAWSEEDENRFKNLIELVEQSDEGQATKTGFIDFINRLKSCKGKEQPTWKPSEEQMRALKYFLVAGAITDPEDAALLSSLRDDLDQLKAL